MANWVLGDDGLAINLDRYDRLDTYDPDGGGKVVNVVAVKDDRHLKANAIQTYRLQTFESGEEALRYIRGLVSGEGECKPDGELDKDA